MYEFIRGAIINTFVVAHGVSVVSFFLVSAVHSCLLNMAFHLSLFPQP